MHGYPDYFGQSIFPKYGAPIEIDLSLDAGPGGSDSVDIVGNGLLYACLIVGTSAGSVKGDNFSVSSGGVLIYKTNIAQSVGFPSLFGDTGLFIPKGVNRDYSYWNLQLHREIPFESSLTFALDCAVDSDPTGDSVTIKGFYYAIT